MPLNFILLWNNAKPAWRKTNRNIHIEKGAGGSISILLKLINYYSAFYVVEHILSPRFEVVQLADTIGSMESVAIERLKFWQEELNGENSFLCYILIKWCNSLYCLPIIF